MPSGADNVLTIHTTDGTERLRIDSSGNVKVGSAATISQDGDVFFTGVCTATTLSGAASGLTGALPAISAANLTNIPAANVTGTLPAISAANLTNVPAANVVGVHTSLNITGATVVGSAVTISESGIEASGIGITCANINGTQIGGRRNLIINGDMRIAQRGGSSTTTSEFVADRFRHAFSMGGGVTITYSQGTLGTSDSPYSEGHRYYIREALSGSTSDASTYYIQMAETRLEARDIAMSGWNYTDPNSKLTLSFWARSSVAMTYGFVLQSSDGTAKLYPKSFALSANTWTKIKHTIPGHSDLQFDNDANNGFTMKIYPFLGSAYCGGTDGAWADQSAGKYGSDNTAVTWLNGANTFDVTGIQLEVGSQATAFEHRSFGEELELCKRYFQVLVDDGNAKSFGNATGYNTSTIHLVTPLRPEMRATPTLDYTTGTDYYGAYQNNAVDYFNDWTVVSNSHTRAVDISAGGGVSITAGSSVLLRTTNASSKIRFSAEL